MDNTFQVLECDTDILMKRWRSQESTHPSPLPLPGGEVRSQEEKRRKFFISN
ncbi:MAG: hypothetical protein F6K18_08460 [Okeania sp. SIO2C2]|uniref:hypothetical protein n=1 Tax=Okeania sp. SIO2C2 TaxID=2607787 RepID=UPI0013B7873C|nr:hypothetical protein [Okeania sp. SIO2C2]NEP86862.1 hypothetical protein [Okeania sp. SIO2C2]